ncbi:creatininase family protein [Paenibacillus sp. CGMCC 1.16610]|uniref:Creatininase family protein n=1 Tax=Paenibacillus anseongense TaxID=2682845 RepID=A0ABW9UFY3_9BACL|nr:MULTISPECIES: creatininase family protein [Paenibacillus]MBA2943744.1 creatininase family protein [Paenibacillus sp. CGMCC 1.16610]MVQ37633.1 creatininase family protein [Paenibacillus anseongense]
MLNFKNTTLEISNSGIDTAVLSVGATEQFGPYLPMHLDTLIAELYATAYGNELNAYVLPTIPFNTSEEHANFKGTVTVSPNILTAMLEDIVCNLIRQGFRKFLVCTGHGGSYWEGAFVKHINYKYPEIIVISANHNSHLAWNEAVEAAGLKGLNEMHGGLLSVCTAMWLCPELVKSHSMGSEIPSENRLYADYLGWDKLTKDGCWGKYDVGIYSQEELADKGKIFWITFIQKRTEGLKRILEEGFRRKTQG